MKVNSKINETAEEAIVEVVEDVFAAIAEEEALVVDPLVRRGTEALSDRIQASKEKQQEKK